MYGLPFFAAGSGHGINHTYHLDRISMGIESELNISEIEVYDVINYQTEHIAYAHIFSTGRVYIYACPVELI